MRSTIPSRGHRRLRAARGFLDTKSTTEDEGAAQIIDELAHEGIAIILISSDLPEVLATSDRILVMREGRQMAILQREEATAERVLAAAMGQDGATEAEAASQPQAGAPTASGQP